MTKLIDLTSAQEDAKKELQAEAMSAAKGKIKSSLKAIAAAEAVVANLKREHEVLLRTIGEQ